MSIFIVKSPQWLQNYMLFSYQNSNIWKFIFVIFFSLGIFQLQKFFLYFDNRLQYVNFQMMIMDFD